MEREADARRGRALSARLALAFIALAACGREPTDKIVGWPPREPIVPVRDVIEDTAPAEPEDVGEPDTAPEVPDVTPETPPCKKIVDMVCELEGRFTDACREARTHVPDDGHAETREACAALYAKFEKDELPRVGSACWRYARELCKTLGDGSEPCKTAQGQVSVRTTRRELRACLGDLLWSATRTFRR